jgi:hypothetical protein
VGLAGNYQADSMYGPGFRFTMSSWWDVTALQGVRR